MIWVIGWSMVVLGVLVFLPATVVAAIGVIIIVGHNALEPLVASIDSPSWFLRVLYAGGSFDAAGLHVVVLYTLIPWAGVMAAGYGFGAVMRMPADKRRRICLAIGIAAVALFIVLRASGIYGDPRPWTGGNPLGFVATTKYPASLLFLLMTLGPMLIAIPLLENARGRLAGWLTVFGRVPFFYYVLHIPTIHLVALLIAFIRTPGNVGWLIANHPMMPPPVPPGYMWSLGLLYLVTAIVVIGLYFPCRWFARVKAGERRPWMRFV